MDMAWRRRAKCGLVAGRATIVANLGLVGVSILTNFWNLNFYDALQALDFDAFTAGVLQFIGLQIAMAALTMTDLLPRAVPDRS